MLRPLALGMWCVHHQCLQGERIAAAALSPYAGVHPVLAGLPPAHLCTICAVLLGSPPFAACPTCPQSSASCPSLSYRTGNWVFGALSLLTSLDPFLSPPL